MMQPDRRAARLVRWYPPAWRAEHGDAFRGLLEDSIAERRFWPRRTFNLAIEGSIVRLTRPERPQVRPSHAGVLQRSDRRRLLAYAGRRLGTAAITLLGATLVVVALAR